MKDYILKLNDRNLQRKKASGITNYVMYSLVVIILIKIFNLIPKTSFDSQWEIIEIIWYSLNFAHATYYIYISFKLSFNNSSSIRILKYSKESNNYFLSGIVLLILLIPFIPVIFISWHRYVLDNFGFRTFEIPLLIGDLINLIFIFVVFFNKEDERFAILKQTQNSKNTNVSVIFLITSIIIIICSIISILSIPQVSNLEKFNLFTISLLSFSLLVIFTKIIEHYKYDIFAQDLENLEYEIHVKNLSDEEIRNILQKKYMGFLINDYLDYKQQEFREKKMFFKQEEVRILEKEKELLKIDKNKYPIEFNGRKEKIDSQKKQLKKEKIGFYSDNEIELKEIMKKDPNLKIEEITKLRFLMKESLENVKNLKK